MNNTIKFLETISTLDLEDLKDLSSNNTKNIYKGTYTDFKELNERLANKFELVQTDGNHLDGDIAFSKNEKLELEFLVDDKITLRIRNDYWFLVFVYVPKNCK